MPLDPKAVEVLEAAAALGGPPLGSVPAEVVRRGMANRPPVPPGPDCHRVEDMEIAGPEGPIPVRMYWPTDAEALPITEIATMVETIVVNVEYRLAPEHPYPAAADDAYAAYVWCVQNGQRFGGDASRIAVMGWSAGGNLAAVVALMARDRGSGSALKHQLLVCPVTDFRFEGDSYDESDGYILSRPGMKWFWDCYLPDESQRAQPYAAPAYAESLEGLPPAHVITAEYDVLRDEGMAYAAALEAAGVPVVAKAYAGQIHTFFTNTHLFEVGAQAVADAVDRLRAALAT